MNIKLIVVSKTDVPYLQAGIDEYIGRLKHYCDFELVVIPALKNGGRLSPEEVKNKEGELILRQLEKVDCVVLLDEHGKEYTSIGFSEFLQKQMNGGVRTLAFVIGGAFGFSSEGVIFLRSAFSVGLDSSKAPRNLPRAFSASWMSSKLIAVMVMV